MATLAFASSAATAAMAAASSLAHPSTRPRQSLARATVTRSKKYVNLSSNRTRRYSRGNSTGGRCVAVASMDMEVPNEEATVKTVEVDDEELCFPFTRIAGQEEMKRALLLNIVDPRIGGVLITGDRGTGKSTVVRSLSDLLPDITTVKGDMFNSDPDDSRVMGPEALATLQSGGKFETEEIKVPLVELPLGATEDRICGTIDIEKALTEGRKSFEPGLLATANRGILYIDEVNLLEDHLVDVVLDSAASGWNTVEREGISIGHPARFILVGSANNEEGEMRPQLLDRFGMMVTVRTIVDADVRTAMVMDRIAFEKDKKAYREHEMTEINALREKLDAAKARLSKVVLPREMAVKISDMCSQLNVDGLRGDITLNRACKAVAALDNVPEVTPEIIANTALPVLRHRLKKDPMDPIGEAGSDLRIIKVFTKVFGKIEED